MCIHQKKGLLVQNFSTILLLCIGLSSQGCGPITAHSSIARAHIAIEAADGARASELATFEYESAILYLRKAKLEEGLSSFQSAIDLSQLARKYADSARARALKNSQAQPLTPTERRRMMLNRSRQVPVRTKQTIRPANTQNSPDIPPMPKLPTPTPMPNQQNQGGM